MQNNIVVSTAFRFPYVAHSFKQEFTIKDSDPDLMYWAVRDVLPVKEGFVYKDIVTEFQKSLYGFKPHMIQKVRDVGFTKVAWLDPSVLPTVSLQCLFDALDTHPVIVRTGDAPIVKMTNKRVMDWFGVAPDELGEVKHVGGTIYGFNFEHQKAVEVFELWKSAEENGMFGTQDEFMAGHWADEACMALSLYKCVVPQVWVPEFKYLNQKEL